MIEYNYSELSKAPLVIGAIYQSGNFKNAKDDPISILIQTENMGGFRRKGSITGEPNLIHLALVSSLSDSDWPDMFVNSGKTFIYYGDNKVPGRKLTDTPKKGNLVLEYIFECYHNGNRKKIPPIFVFIKNNNARDVVFKGIAVPGSNQYLEDEDLVAIWKTKGQSRFQNYRSVFTILDIEHISRKWIKDINEGKSYSENAPQQWLMWMNGIL